VKSTDPDKVIDACPAFEAKNLTGALEDAAEPSHHQAGVHRNTKSQRQFERGWKPRAWWPANAWSKRLDGSRT